MIGEQFQMLDRNLCLKKIKLVALATFLHKEKTCKEILLYNSE